MRTLAVIASTDFQGHPYGGTASFVGDLLGGLDVPEDMKIELVGTTSDPDGVLRPSTRTFGPNRYSVTPIAVVGSPSRLPVRSVVALGAVRRAHAIRALGADVIYAHSPELARACQVAAPGVPVVLHCHGGENPLHLSRFRAARSLGLPQAYESGILRPALKASRAVFVNGDSDQMDSFVEHHRRFLPGEIARIPAIVDRRVFQPLDRATCRDALGISRSATVAVFVGRLELPKGVDLLLRAMALLRNSRPELQILIVGDGTQRAQLEELAAGLGLGQVVRFVGSRMRSEIPECYGAADVFVSASLREAISMALLEALACGIPGVVTDAGGARELVQDGWNGAIVGSRDPAALATRVSDVLHIGGETKGRCLQVASRYDSRNVAARVLQVLVRACDGQAVT